MLKVYKLKEKKMELSDILKYIEENTPEKKSKEEINEIYDSEKIHIGREYIIKDKYGIKNIFIMSIKDRSSYLTHIYENPHQELELEDDDII